MPPADAWSERAPAQSSARLGICIQPGPVRAGCAVEVHVSVADDVGKDLSRSQQAPLLRFSCDDEAGPLGVSPAEAPRPCGRPQLLTLSRGSTGWARLTVEADGALGATSPPFRAEGPAAEAGAPAARVEPPPEAPCDLPMRRLALGALPRLQLFESRERGVRHQIWDGGLALARFLASAPPERWLAPAASGPGLRALELGAGTGAGSLALAALGFSVVATDEDEESLGLLRLSAAASGLGGRVETAPLRWGAESRLLGGAYDAVVAADVAYYEDSFIPLVRTLVLLAHDGTAVLLAHRPRGDGEQQVHFFHLLEAEFDLEPIHYDVGLGVTIYRLYRSEDKKSREAVAASSCDYCCFLQRQHAELNEWPYVGVV